MTRNKFNQMRHGIWKLMYATDYFILPDSQGNKHLDNEVMGQSLLHQPTLKGLSHQTVQNSEIHEALKPGTGSTLLSPPNSTNSDNFTRKYDINTVFFLDCG